MDWKKILSRLGNKYVIATLVFLVVFLFLDEFNISVTSRLHRQVNRLHAEERELKKAIEADSINAAVLKDNPDAIEHYGREQYYMKQPNEDIFVIRK